jgi:PAS domain S-box-containing protein
LKMFGRAPFSEPLHFGSFLREVHEEDQEKVRLRFQQAIERDVPYYVEIRLVKPDGPLRWAVEHGQILRDDDGKVVRMVGVTMDITESKKMAEEIRQVSEFREAVISRAAEGICVCHAIPEFPYVRFSVWNERMREITGYTLEEINRLGWYQTMYPDPVLQKRAIERMARMWEGDDLREEEWTITTKREEERILAISTTVLSGSESGSVIALMHDVTERRRAEEVIAVQRAELLHCSRLSTLGQMASTLSHEIAQPLSAIANYAGAGMAILNRGDLSEQERVSSYLLEIMEQSRRTSDILRQMCRYGRKSPTMPSISNLNSVAHDALRLLSLELRRHDIHVEVRLAEESVLAHIERVQLEQVIVNLLTNSMEAINGPNSGDRRIVLKTYARRGWGFLEIEDFGPGVPASIKGRLFECFITTKDEGAGIGLSICRDILREQGGDIQYVEPDHSGAIFQIRLPRVSPDAATRSQWDVLND